MSSRQGTTATGKPIADCFCPSCDEYSGGGLCRLCQREQAIGSPPADAKPFVAVVCSRGGGCEVVSLPRARDAQEAAAKRQEALF